MKFELKTTLPKTDLLILLLQENESISAEAKKLLTANEYEQIEKRMKAKDFTGKCSDNMVIYGDNKKLILMGMGKIEKDCILPYEQAGGKSASMAKNLKAAHVSILIDGKNLAEYVNGFVLGNYEFNQFKKAEKDVAKIESVTFICEKNTATQEALVFAEYYNEGQKLIRDLVNTPAGSRNTIDVANLTKELAKKYGIKCTVYDEKELKKMGCGAILGVGRGGEYPPRMMTLEYNHKSKAKTPSVAFVGKGITFDTGGLNIKPTGHIETMKLDLAGAITVLATMIIIARSKLQGHFVGVMVMAENAVSDRSMHPGDILKAYNGKTIEVLNTDAEGRLVLADALAFTEDKFKPQKMVDVATLTGAVTVALGYHISGLMGNNEAFINEIMDSAKDAKERMWVLPLDKDFVDATKGDISDTKNSTDGVRAGATMGAAFLQQFVEKTNWAHIDIGGTGWVEKPKSTIKFGGTAVILRTFWELAKRNSI